MKLEVTKDQAALIITALRMYAAEANQSAVDQPTCAKQWRGLEKQAHGLVQYIEAKIENKAAR